MPPLTEELIRKRAEHNEGILADLEEIALHQEEIETIEKCLGKRCRRIKILLLQNNVIGRLENLNKLKELEYLNVAVNNIEKIEGLERCESLRKLDLTVNFIDIENLKDSITNLECNYNLEDLYLLGNPCMDWPKARKYVVARLPGLLQLDGTLVTPSERIQAKRDLPMLEKELEKSSGYSIKKKNYEREHGIKPHEDAYTVESRLEMYREQAAAKEEKEKREKKRLGGRRCFVPLRMFIIGLEPKPPRRVPEPMNQRGEIRQCNEGKYNFHIDEFGTPGTVVMEIDVPAFLETSLIDVDVQPNYVRCIIKDKLTQLKTPCEVAVHASTVKRSSATGALRIEMPRADRSGFLRVKESDKNDRRNGEAKTGPPPQVPSSSGIDDGKIKNDSSGAKFLPLSQGVSLRIVDPVREEPLLEEADDPHHADDDYDESDVPPLEAISAYLEVTRVIHGKGWLFDLFGLCASSVLTGLPVRNRSPSDNNLISECR
ncbi:hypothetical protein FOZ63_033977 [Perkinsus olseni]|uniref:Dynein axonemal assembly factor 11-like CS domain-containing protein n=1 Tax=Perkinsus olseni TaxID=32597 RepID=A0A7J6TD75_PEROL|nr:hypothetical protein FOZ63_033977 [Perkinsus olseni]